MTRTVLLLASLVAFSALVLAAPSASASCFVTLGPKEGAVCTTTGPQGQPGLCAYENNSSNIDPPGQRGCVAVGVLGTNLVCAKAIPQTNWVCV